MKPIDMALASCAFPKMELTVRGVELRSIANSTPMARKPSRKPSNGDANIGMTTFPSSPFGYHCPGSGSDQMTTSQLRAAATAAPISPPTNA
jgi:hypothetical protein